MSSGTPIDTMSTFDRTRPYFLLARVRKPKTLAYIAQTAGVILFSQGVTFAWPFGGPMVALACIASGLGILTLVEMIEQLREDLFLAQASARSSSDTQ